jgi:hypothetical protein
MQSVQQIVSSPTARQPLSPLENAQRRLARAIEALSAAERAEEREETSVVRHGGPGRCSAAIISRALRAHVHTFVAGVEVDRWEQRLRDAMVAEHDDLAAQGSGIAPADGRSGQTVPGEHSNGSARRLTGASLLERSGNMSSLRVKPNAVLPGDRLRPRHGLLAGVLSEVVAVRRGLYSTYTLELRPLENATCGVDYGEMLLVERSERQGA